MKNVSHTIRRNGIYYFSMRLPSSKVIYRHSLQSDSSRQSKIYITQILEQVKKLKREGIVLNTDKLKGIVECILSNRINELARHTKAVLSPLSDEASNLNKAYQTQTSDARYYNYHAVQYDLAHRQELLSFTEYIVNDFDKTPNDINFFREWDEDEEEYLVPDENSFVHHDPIYIQHETVMESLRLQTTQLKSLLLQGEHEQAESLLARIVKAYSKEDVPIPKEPDLTPTPVIAPVTAPVIEAVDVEILFPDAVDAFVLAKEKENTQIQKKIELGKAVIEELIDMKEYKKHLNNFKVIIGSKLVNQLTTRDLNEAMQIVINLPVKNKPQYVDNYIYSRYSLEERIEEARKEDVDLKYIFARSSIEKAKISLNKLFQWLYSESYINTCVTRDMEKLPKGKKLDRADFDFPTANKILDYCKDNLDSDFSWIALIMAYSGLRNSEVIQLRKIDINKSKYGDISYFYITPEAGRLKNNSSHRNVPIHKELLKLGFINYISKHEGERIFKCTGQQLAKWYRKLKAALDIPSFNEKGEILSLYSFRHSVRTIFATLRAAEEYKNPIMGHKGNNTGDATYAHVDVYPLKFEMDQVTYNEDELMGKVVILYSHRMGELS
jgi:integrase